MVELGRRPHVAASYFDWSFVEELPDLSDGGLHLPLVGSGLIRFSPPREFSACTAVALGDAQDDGISDPQKISLKLHANLGACVGDAIETSPGGLWWWHVSRGEPRGRGVG